ncbi:Hypothetical protein PENO1_076990 [Penicillium occitanis (nom. inval.)]|nr:Hypothetical protein PENO1_076990 [Penicillium occitanis (nom. inval.)]PCH06845.1 hypothetical protein PENOC_022210 [Penicillium occitanis (nom. inval.)]
MRGQVRPKQLPTTSSSAIPIDSFNKGFDNGLPMPTFDANDDIFDNIVMDWAIPGNNLLMDNFESISQLQPPATDDNTTSSTDNEVASGQNHADTRSDGSLRDDEIRILEYESAQRPKRSSHYLGIDVPDTLQSPNVFLQLTSMSVTLESLARQLPSFTVHSQSLNAEKLNPEFSDDEVNFGVGKTYALTHKLADIYVPLIEQTQQRKELSRDGVHDPADRPMESVDTSLLWLLFSCHNRLIDLWHAMLLHAKMVQDTDRYSPDAAGAHKARCARFKMGPYEPSSSSTVVAMEIIVLQELAMHLATRLNNLIEVMQPDNNTDGPPSTTEDNSQSLKATVLMAKALHERALAMRAEVSQQKSMLEESIAKKSSIRKGRSSNVTLRLLQNVDESPIPGELPRCIQSTISLQGNLSGWFADFFTDNLRCARDSHQGDIIIVNVFSTSFIFIAKRNYSISKSVNNDDVVTKSTTASSSTSSIASPPSPPSSAPQTFTFCNTPTIT